MCMHVHVHARACTCAYVSTCGMCLLVVYLWFSVNAPRDPKGSTRRGYIVRAHRFGQLGVLVVRLVRARLHYDLVACERKGACVPGVWPDVVMAW